MQARLLWDFHQTLHCLGKNIGMTWIFLTVISKNSIPKVQQKKRLFCPTDWQENMITVTVQNFR